MAYEELLSFSESMDPSKKGMALGKLKTCALVVVELLSDQDEKYLIVAIISLMRLFILSLRDSYLVWIICCLCSLSSLRFSLMRETYKKKLRN